MSDPLKNNHKIRIFAYIFAVRKYFCRKVGEYLTEANLQVPEEIEADPSNMNEMDDRVDVEVSEDEDIDVLLDEVDPVESEEGISQEKLQKLEKIRMKQR